MQTFETEKGNIPKGATHYCKEVNGFNFSWFKGVDTDNFEVLSISTGGKWLKGDQCWYANAGINPIPQTKDAKWDGEYQLNGGKGWFKYKTTYTSSSGDMFAMCLIPNANKGKPFEQYLDLATTKFRTLETEAERVEREELEAAYDLYCHVSKEANRRVYPFEVFCDESLANYKIDCLAIVRKTGYRKESE